MKVAEAGEALGSRRGALLADIGVADGEVARFRIEGRGVERPCVGGGQGIAGGSGEGFELREVFLAQGARFAEGNAGGEVELIVVDGGFGGAVFGKEEDDRPDAGGKDLLGEIEHPVQAAGIQEPFANGDGGGISIGEEGVFDDDGGTSARFELGDEVLHEEERGFPRLDGEIGGDIGTGGRTKGRIGKDDVHAVAIREVGDALGKGVPLFDVRGAQSVEDAIHLRRDIREGLFLAPVERFVLEDIVRLGAAVAGLLLQILESLAQEASGAARAIIDGFAQRGGQNTNHHLDKRAGRVVLAAIAPGIAHGLQALLIKHGKLVPRGFRLEDQWLNEVDDLTDKVAIGEGARQFREDGPHPIGGRVNRRGVPQGTQSGEKLGLDEKKQRIALQHPLRVQRAIGLGWPRPIAPRQSLRQKGLIRLIVQLRLAPPIGLRRIKIAQKEHPVRLLHVLQRIAAPAAGLAQHLINRLEHRRRRFPRDRPLRCTPLSCHNAPFSFI